MTLAKKFLGHTFIYGLATVLPRLANVFLVKLHTELLPPSAYAVNTSFYVYIAYLNVILTLGMETSFFRFFSAYKRQRRAILSTSFWLLCLVAFIFVILLFLFSDTLSGLLGILSTKHLRLMGLTIFFDTLTVIPFAYLRVFGNSRRFSLIKLLNTAVYILMNLLLLWIIPSYVAHPTVLDAYDGLFATPNVDAIFIANVVASVSTLMLLIPVLLKIRWALSKAILRSMLRYGLPIVGAGLAYITIENMDKLLLQWLVGAEQMGVYAACYKLGVVMNMYILAFRLGAEPFFFAHASKGYAKAMYAMVLKWFFIAGSMLYLFCVLFLDVLSGLLLGNAGAYQQGLAIVPMILLSNLLFGGYTNLSIWYKLKGKTYYGLYFSLTGAVLTVVINYVFMPKYGFWAAAYATLISYGVMFLISYFMGQKHYKIPYQIKPIMAYLLVAVLLGAVGSALNILWLNILIGLLFIGIVYALNKKEMRSIVQ